MRGCLVSLWFLAVFGLGANSALGDPQKFFFEGYAVGKNNRAAFGALIRDLQDKFKHKVEYGFAERSSATRRMIYIGEAEIDRMVAVHQKVSEILSDVPRFTGHGLKVSIEATVRFVVAHEYFHSALLHLQLYDGMVPDGVRISASGEKLQAALELQADYFAAAYLILEDLPVRPVKTFIADKYESPVLNGYTLDQLDNFTEADWDKFWIPQPGYPRHRDRELETAMSTFDFRWDLFNNDMVNCQKIVEANATLSELSRVLGLLTFFDFLERQLDRATNYRPDQP